MIIFGQYFIIMLASKDTNNYVYGSPPSQIRILLSEMILQSLTQFECEY
jgi:hypothetical protein